MAPSTSWNDDDLRDAVAAATNWTEVCDALDLAGDDLTRGHLRRRAAQLGLPIDRLDVRGRGRARRTWTDEDLAEAVSTAHNLNGVFRRLRLRVGGSSWISMQEHILRLGLDTSHWTSRLRPGDAAAPEPLPAWSDDAVRAAFEGARSVAEVMRRLGLDAQRKRGRREVERRLRALGLDVGSLAGQSWAHGRSVPVEQRRARPLEEILVSPSDHGNTHRLKQRLIAEGLKEARCESCGSTEWLGQPIPLHLDHIDGDRRNNRLTNLRLLCPNCHALTDTYCGRNIGGRYSVARDDGN